MIKVIGVICVLLFGYLVTTKVFPFFIVRIGRLLGFRMVMNPLTKKRVQRFKRIQRGYYSFMVLAVLFVTSLFLEVIVNHKPIYVRYEGQTAYPALRDLARMYFGSVITIPDFDRAGDFGVPGEMQLDYRRFTGCVEDPEGGFAKLLEAKKKELEGLQGDLADTQEEVDMMREDGDEPDDFLVEDLKMLPSAISKLEDAIREIEKSQQVFTSGGASVIWPLYRFSPYESRLNLPGISYFPPTLWRLNDGYMEFIKEAMKEKNFDTVERALGSQALASLQANFEKLTENDRDKAILAVIKTADRDTLREVTGLHRWSVPLGTGPAGVDIVPQLLYGFRVSVAFALAVLIVGYFAGVFVGGMMGFYGGWTDIGLQRFIEIWGSIPFLFTIMIIAEIVHPSFWMLVVLLIVLRSWLAITYLIRGEFYREKARDYVQAAIGTGMGDLKVMMKHILPNSLVPVVSRAPFSFVNYISLLVSLDYLGFGLPPGTPSWGGMLRAGAPLITMEPRLVLVPVIIFAVTLLMVVMIGEAVREAFDPKVLARLR